MDVNGEEKEVSETESLATALSYREITTDTMSGLKVVILDFRGLDDPNTRVIAPIVELIKKRFAR